MKSEILKQQHDRWIRISLSTLAIIILILVYLFQRTSLVGLLGGDTEAIHPNVLFILNRTARMVLNDAACFVLIYAVFRERKYLKLAFVVFLIELLVILPVYLVIKLTIEGDSEISSPLLSQIHRLIVNPTLMILLMAGFAYQKYFKR